MSIRSRWRARAMKEAERAPKSLFEIVRDHPPVSDGAPIPLCTSYEDRHTASSWAASGSLGSAVCRLPRHARPRCHASIHA